MCPAPQQLDLHPQGARRVAASDVSCCPQQDYDNGAVRSCSGIQSQRVSEPVGKRSRCLLIGCRYCGAGSSPSGMGWRAGCCTGQFPGHDHDGGPQHHGFVVFGSSFVVADQTAVTQQPAEGPFHDPPAGQHDESGGVVAALDGVTVMTRTLDAQLTRRPA